ncbi:MAG TPA: tol-pal system protein YbgF [Candidatus Acidoferrales bacterium]
MRGRSIALGIMAVGVGLVGGSLLSPRPTGAVSKEMLQLQDQVAQLLQGQQSMRSAIDANNASTRTLIQQQLDAINSMNAQMTGLQKSVGEATANDSSKIDAMTSQTQGISDNLQDVQARVGKLATQMNDIQSLLQSIDGRLAGGATPSASYTPPVSSGPTAVAGGAGAPADASAPAPTPTRGLAGMPGIASDTLYQNALRDFTTGKYDLARQEFSDYVKNFGSTDLASNAQFYLGEISYAQGDYKDAVGQYNNVLNNYPQSYKLAASLLKKGMAELELGMKATGARDLKEVVRRFPGSDESRRASAKLKELGIPTTSRSAPR